MNATDFLWQKAAEKLFVTKEQFLASLEGWDIEAVGDLGYVLRKGPEFHFATTGKSIPRSIMREVLRPQFDEFGYVTTRTPKVDTRQHRFNRAYGMVPIGEDEFDVIYRLDKNRSAACR